MKKQNLRTTIEQERNRVAEQLLNLHQENEKDSATLKSLKEEYSKAVFDIDVKLMDEFNTKIRHLAEVIQERKLVIETLSDQKNPIIQRTVAEASKAWLEELKQIDHDAATLGEELLQYHQKVVDGLIKLQTLRERAYRLESNLEDYSKLLNQDTQNSISLPKNIGMGELVNIRKYMDPLLITQYVKR
jgi:chromosome segregation ATPase